MNVDSVAFRRVNTLDEISVGDKLLGGSEVVKIWLIKAYTTWERPTVEIHFSDGNVRRVFDVAYVDYKKPALKEYPDGTIVEYDPKKKRLAPENQ